MTDPLAGKYLPVSPYSYCAGDPVNLVDPRCMEGVKTIDNNGDITISSNVVVLLEGIMAIPEYASEKEIRRITKRNERIKKRNEDRLLMVKQFISEEFRTISLPSGNTVSFEFNIISKEVSNPTTISLGEAISIALDNGIPNVVTPNRVEGTRGYGIAAAAVIGSGGAGGAYGLTRGGVLITINDYSARTLAHELGHTFGLPDNYPNSYGGLMDYPAGPITTKDVRNIIYKSYESKH